MIPASTPGLLEFHCWAEGSFAGAGRGFIECEARQFDVGGVAKGTYKVSSYQTEYADQFSFSCNRTFLAYSSVGENWVVGDYFEIWLVNSALSVNPFNYVLFQTEVSWHPNP